MYYQKQPHYFHLFNYAVFKAKLKRSDRRANKFGFRNNIKWKNSMEHFNETRSLCNFSKEAVSLTLNRFLISQNNGRTIYTKEHVY